MMPCRLIELIGSSKRCKYLNIMIMFYILFVNLIFLKTAFNWKEGDFMIVKRCFGVYDGIELLTLLNF